MTYYTLKYKLKLLLAKEKNISPITALLFIAEFYEAEDISNRALIQIIAQEFEPKIDMNNLASYYSYRANLFLYLEKIGDLRKKMLIDYINK
jgi:hypothetical protein